MEDKEEVGNVVIPPEFIPNDKDEAIMKIPPGSLCLVISPTLNREGYGINLVGNSDLTLPITLSQSMYAIMKGCIEAIKYKKESLFKLAIIAARREKREEIDPDNITWNKETPKQYLKEAGVKGNA